MNTQTVQVISKLRNKSQSDLARMAGVSRQAVSHWFQASDGGEADVRSSHVKALAEGLGVTADTLLRELPVLDDPRVTHRLETALLWDRLFPSLAEFSIAICRGDLAALARLAQVYGLFRAAKIAGPNAWKRFPQYKRLIRPVRRELLERIWKIHQHPELI